MVIGTASPAHTRILSVRLATIAVVKPHARSALCPMRTKGMPGTVTRLACSSGAFSSSWYHTEGRVGARWGSLASSATPPAVRGPVTAQPLLAAPGTRSCSMRY